MSDESENPNMNLKIQKRKRGAPLGNQNAFKHGFYTRNFTQQEVSDLKEIEGLDVHHEIELIRALMRRVLESSNTASTHADNIYTLRAICLGNFTLTRLIRTQFLKPKDPGHNLVSIIGEILDEIDSNILTTNQDLIPRL